MPLQPFLSFWGKARPPKDAIARWHPTACHCLDVAAVAEALLRAHPAAAKAIARACGWVEDDLIGMVIFLAALHDIGKFSRPFQAKAPEHWPPALGPYGNMAGPRHDEVGLCLLRDDAILDVGTVLPGWADEQVDALCCAAEAGTAARKDGADVFPARSGMNRRHSASSGTLVPGGSSMATLTTGVTTWVINPITWCRDCNGHCTPKSPPCGQTRSRSGEHGERADEPASGDCPPAAG